ncbi:methylated-DNA--[protein]-cysteine S-methyltransferase [Kineococcus sp. NPDC059986]|jgi:methylated-DNA-[protein]-cysteine S-methyltransferase|uniref:methylated-DNA--[protein]-cysteine S-methyltransferase n=1 Tax=Kineococcus sp. NPDC059986 TaxID=3155538 RepID=UPI00344BB572
MSLVEAHLTTRLRERLAQRAAEAGVLDVAYRTVDSPLGSLLVAATTAGVVRVAFEQQGHDAAVEELAQRISPRVLRAPARLDPLARELEEYFAGRRHVFDVPVDLSLAPGGLRRSVLDALPHIGFGLRISYAELAAAVGSPRAVRAVGTACARNPVPLVLPCHRVVRSDGSTGQYAGGAEAKGRLLELERRDKVGA